MKKVLSAVACAAVIGWAGSAMAGFYTDPNLNVYKFEQGQSRTWSFDLDNDVLYGIDIEGTDLSTIDWGKIPYVDINAEDQIVSAYFSIAYIDDSLIDKKEKFTLTMDGLVQNVQSGWSNYLIGLSVVDVTAKLQDHLLVVTLESKRGDFYAGLAAVSGEFIDKAAPVPEPTTMLLFGTGLLGLAAVGRRRVATKA